MKGDPLLQMVICRLVPLWGAAVLAAVPVAAAPSSSTRAAGTPPATAAATPVSLTRKPVHTSSPLTAAPVSTAAGPIVATVNGEPITHAEWQARMQLVAGKSALDNLVRQKILQQEARKKGVTLTAKDIATKALEDEKGYRDRAGSPARFDDFLKQNGLSLAGFRSAMRY